MDAHQFAGFLVEQGYADSTVRAYRAMWVRWCDWAADANVDPLTLDPTDLRAWQTTLPKARPILAHAAGMVRQAAAALEVGDRTGTIRLPAGQRKPRCRALPDADTARLLDHAADAGIRGLAVAVGLYTGARRSEIASLRWDRVDFDGGIVTLQRDKSRDLHDVPLHPDLAAALEQRRLDGDDGWVFPGRWGGHVSPSTVWRWICDLAGDAGIGHVTPHQLRHTAIATVNDATGDLRAAQEFAGHANPTVTAGYTRVTDERLRNAVTHLRWDAA